MDILSQMMGDKLWIYTAIGGSIVGWLFSTYFKTTVMGLWIYAKFDLTLDYLIEKFGWSWLEQQDDAWRKKYPFVTKKIDELENRIKELEK